jgi:hypothetical protein
MNVLPSYNFLPFFEHLIVMLYKCIYIIHLILDHTFYTDFVYKSFVKFEMCYYMCYCVTTCVTTCSSCMSTFFIFFCTADDGY